MRACSSFFKFLQFFQAVSLRININDFLRGDKNENATKTFIFSGSAGAFGSV